MLNKYIVVSCIIKALNSMNDITERIEVCTYSNENIKGIGCNCSNISG